MSSKSSIHKKGQYIYKPLDKKQYGTVEFIMDIYYPRINNKSVKVEEDVQQAVMRATSISSETILIESRIPLVQGDFINFTLTIGANPSFWCLAKVKNVEQKNSRYHADCEFISLNMNQINLIKNYCMNKH
ncbi:PilZ domain-containing protein [Clostridium sp. A1-XYC3]|uniref:PilZ domain-containing protein n=1 Tax=Clostridium tanneri TaxID=3037988 RepID=A0ABU4JQD3_9CLOT|nr:PilZ domain-containing protein [Clostridium sp. A1-XYC3]MDW8800368.1 PilZ domain-containing protein [Clostridium sp. A1-XYC3]